MHVLVISTPQPTTLTSWVYFMGIYITAILSNCPLLHMQGTVLRWRRESTRVGPYYSTGPSGDTYLYLPKRRVHLVQQNTKICIRSFMFVEGWMAVWLRCWLHLCQMLWIYISMLPGIRLVALLGYSSDFTQFNYCIWNCSKPIIYKQCKYMLVFYIYRSKCV
jgi:hypothetical protein